MFVATGFTGSTFGYTGAVMDEESGLAYMRNRYYSARLGRFVNTDPIGFAGGVNLYAYADANPLAMWDPMGLDAGEREPVRRHVQSCVYALVVGRRDRRCQQTRQRGE